MGRGRQGQGERRVICVSGFLLFSLLLSFRFFLSFFPSAFNTIDGNEHYGTDRGHGGDSICTGDLVPERWDEICTCGAAEDGVYTRSVYEFEIRLN